MNQPVNQAEVSEHHPYVPDQAQLHEFTWRAVLLGVFLGILFGASSLYLLLKVGMTVSASVPIAVLSITLFRSLSQSFGFRRVTILENNIVQTTGSAGESIAFGVGVTMPALFLLGYEMDVTRVMTVSILGGLLGILMMIPLRRAFIVKQHGKLPYPEGTACAEVLMAGDKGGSSARMVFIGFGIALAYKFCTAAGKLWSDEPSQNLYTVAADGSKSGLKGAAISGELSPELLGVGYIIGPRIASLMMAGAVLSYFVIAPLIATFGEHSLVAIGPAQLTGGDPRQDAGLIRNMGPAEIKANYLRFIGAGAVAAGGIISMCRALPLILSSILAGLRDLRTTRSGGRVVLRTQRDISMKFVLFGSIALVCILMSVPSLGLGFSPQGLIGAVMVLLFGFLFVTVSSRLTGEVGSSSNPISGMTIATLLMICLIFWILGRTGPSAMLTALTVAAVVCIASSNGGTTSQDLKTGFLVGATPSMQQWSILIGAITSAMVIGLTMLALNAAGSHYTIENLPATIIQIPSDAPRERAGKPHADDTKTYRIVHIRRDDQLNPGIASGRYLVSDDGIVKYRTDLPIDRRANKMDNGKDAPKSFAAPQPQLFTSIIEGILGGSLEWGLVIIGALIAVTMEFAGVSALPLAVGMYIPLAATTPIFCGGLLRWLTDRLRGGKTSDADSETSSGVLLSSGYIAGGTLCGLILAFFAFLPEGFNEVLKIGKFFGDGYNSPNAVAPRIVSVVMFLGLATILAIVGSRRVPAAPSLPEK